MEEPSNTQEEQFFFQNLQNQKAFEIMPCEENVGYGDEKHFNRLNLTEEQKTQISELLQHIPTAAAAGTMAGAYTVKFPKGLPHTLISLKQGGFGSQILNNGKFVGSASFYPIAGQATILGVFTVMSVVTGQFFLTRINKELHMINKTLDEIMKFLYGDKRAELLSELSFIRYARDNYASIMVHEAHRAATIVGIQGAKKIAMKDIEFYMNDFENQIASLTKKNFADMKQKMDNDMKQVRNNLDFSMQLYLMSCLMEVFYAQNFEKAYIGNLKENIENYVKSCNNQELRTLGKLDGYLETCNVSAKEKPELERYKEKVNGWLQEQKYDGICENLYNVLDASTKNAEYYLKSNGDSWEVYYKSA